MTKKRKTSGLPKKRAATKKATAATKKAGRPTKVDATSSLNDNDAKKKLIDIATTLFGEKGLDGVSTREIALCSGLNISLISYYFGGKLGLYKEVLRSHITKFTSTISIILDRGEKTKITPDSLRADMRMILDNFTKMGEPERNMMKIMAREKSMGMPYAAAVQDEIATPFADRLVGLIRQAQKQGFVRTDINPHTFFILFFESFFGYLSVSECNLSMRKKAHQIPAQSEEFKDAILDIFLKGITK